MAVACRELKWLRQLLSNLHLLQSSPIPLYYDTQTTIHITTNHAHHKRSKHIEIDHHFLRDEYQENQISFTFVP